MILPTIPAIAKEDVRSWNAQGKRAARRILNEAQYSTCKNCQGLGEVIISFLGAGPTKTPVATKKPSTYIKDEGWFLIEATKSYACPVCSGERIMRLPGAVRPEVRAQTRQVADRLTRRVDIDDDMPSL